jgi:hypothetical protein
VHQPGAALLPGASNAATPQGSSAPKPTVVLVHGAFADASGWAGVEHRLRQRGYTVIAPANPLRGVASDAAYVAGMLASIKGPIVLVGHSCRSCRHAKLPSARSIARKPHHLPRLGAARCAQQRRRS